MKGYPPADGSIEHCERNGCDEGVAVRVSTLKREVKRIIKGCQLQTIRVFGLCRTCNTRMMPSTVDKMKKRKPTPTTLCRTGPKRGLKEERANICPANGSLAGHVERGVRDLLDDSETHADDDNEDASECLLQRRHDFGQNQSSLKHYKDINQ